MALGVTVEFVVDSLGHDGSEVVWPALPEPYCRRAFHIQELVFLAWQLGYTATPFEACPTSQGRADVEPIVLQMRTTPHERMSLVMESQPGVMVGETLQGQPHAVAWDGVDCHDPNGTTYGPQGFRLRSFWAIKSA